MQLESKTLDVLANFADINSKLFIAKGRLLTTWSPHHTILARATINEKFSEDLAIFNLSKLIGILKLFDKPDFTVNSEKITIKEGAKHAYITLGSAEMMKPLPPDKEYNVTPHVSFVMTKELLAEIRSAAAIFEHKELVVSGDGKHLKLETTNVNNPTPDLFQTVVGKTDKTCRLVISIENFKVLPQDYQADISFRGLHRLHADDPAINYYIAVDQQRSTIEDKILEVVRAQYE